ncbi:hypothetical protein NLG97_g2726 [Lecanicillium saksenae]|uniref:Uncharacterized protein n=1 Tax=Lecanicillium saksenae TaxID=468837 RepID=A0ACC1R1U9_9HYPO|nr:hypothetical protein NLG97_g2726 [Lecanicillium saksenae]
MPESKPSSAPSSKPSSIKSSDGVKRSPALRPQDAEGSSPAGSEYGKTSEKSSVKDRFTRMFSSKEKSVSTDERNIAVASPPTGDDDDDDDEPRSRVFNGVTYIRKSHGSFKGKLVSPGKIITIEGQDYVEYCVLAKLSFV